MEMGSTGSCSLLLTVSLTLVGVTLGAGSGECGWEQFKVFYNKTYGNIKEETYRRAVWSTNIKQIEKHNEEADKGHHSYWLKVNHLADWTTEEVENTLNGLQVDLSPVEDLSSGNQSTTLLTIPTRIDWRERGYVTPVKNQGSCGSCYAFSATGSLEGQHFRKTRRLVSLSEQNIIDCSLSYGNHGCHSGLMDKAFRYIIANRGLDTENSYAYEAERTRCHYNPRDIGARMISYHDIRRFDEQELAEAVGTVGPVSVAVDARGPGFHLYSHGVYSNPFCSSYRLDHGVLITGYDVTEDGQEFWIIKNSWGKYWGDNGYIKIAKNKGNMCGIASLASYPVV